MPTLIATIKPMGELYQFRPLANEIAWTTHRTSFLSHPIKHKEAHRRMVEMAWPYSFWNEGTGTILDCMLDRRCSLVDKNLNQVLDTIGYRMAQSSPFRPRQLGIVYQYYR